MLFMYIGSPQKRPQLQPHVTWTTLMIDDPVTDGLATEYSEI